MTDVIGRWAPHTAPACPPGNSARLAHEPPAGEAGSPAFVLSGGGNLGALQVGMMYALVESGLRPGMIVGTSVGAINGAFFASRPDLPGIAEIARLWSSLRRKDVLGVDLGTLLGGMRGRPRHLFDASLIRRILDTFVTFRRLEDAPIPLTVVATALGTGEAVVLNSGDATTALLASSAVPRLLPAVEIDGRLLVDGAAAADVPVREALALGARDLYVLPTAPAQVDSLREQSAACGKLEGTDVPTVHVVPPPDMHIPLARLGQSQDLLRLGYEQARAWLEGAPLPGTMQRVGRGPRFSFRPRISP
jgi:predicted acylesterase/phospholipase RssA